MCGIAGIITIHPTDSARTVGIPESLQEMLDRIIHRGPDDSGTFIDDQVAIGMRRLSIIDVAGGKQPIASTDGSLVIVFNGEIYNFKELREGLLARGHTFKTQTDTEVILHLYEERGEEVVHELRGMFTFFIYDQKKEKLFVARDPFGIKPLYYLKKGDSIIALASEIKSLLVLPEYKRQINEEAIFHYLSYQFNPLKETFFKNIYRLPPATSLSIDIKTGTFQEKKYWSFSFNQDEKMDEKENAEKLSQILIDSVKHHLISDVPIGAFLSGGVDSALIVGAIRKVYPQGELKTFTIGSQEINEFAEAKEQADALHTTHTEILLDPDEYFSALPKIAWHFDEPVADPSAVALYFLAREASKHVKVVLSGEGADELFGGYGIYREPLSLARFNRVPKFLRSIILLLTRLPFDRLPFKMKGINFLRRYQKKIEDRYIGNAYIFSEYEARKIWRGAVYKKYDLSAVYENAQHLSDYLSDSEKMQFIDMHTWLPGDILAKADKMNMAHSLELRVPFLDKEVANFARTIPDRLKYVNNLTKHLLRRAAESLVPKTTQKRKKLGFPVPLPQWLRNRNDWQEKLCTHSFITARFDTHLIKKIIDAHMSGRVNNARKIFIFMMLIAWHDAYFGDSQ